MFHLSRGFNFNLFLLSSLIYSTKYTWKTREDANVVIHKTTNLHNFDSRVLSYSDPGDREGKDLAKEVKILHAAETVLVFPSPALVYPEMEIT